MSKNNTDDDDLLPGDDDDNITALCDRMVSDIITLETRQRNEHVVTEDVTEDNSLFKEVLGDSSNTFDQFLDVT